MGSKTYSSNPEVQATIEALIKLGCPPIPVAPKQNPRDEWCHIRTKTKEGYSYCPIDSNLNPIPRFKGKNPSYLDWKGSPRYVKHGEFQDRLPTESELKKFFRNPKTGVGTLGGHVGVSWLDFDAKCYPSQSDCDNDVARIISNICSHTGVQEDDLWIERTGSGGWRVAVKPLKLPTFTNFATAPDGEHVGEALYKGRFTVLAPTIHPNGNPYRRIGWGNPVEVESLEAIGIYPTLGEVKTTQHRKKREQKKASYTSYDKPSNPQDNPWDIRNFAHYFEGYHEKSDGWGYAKCPHHNGTSPTSFRVKLSTGQFKVWCGCNTKDVYQSGLELAQRLGYKLPEKQERDRDRDRLISQDEWFLKHGFKNLPNLLSNLFKGFGEKPKPKDKPRKKSTQPKQKADCSYQDGQRLATWLHAVAAGHKFILDKSGTGLGKSHTAGLARPAQLGVRKLVYLSPDHRNPTTKSIEDNYVDLPVRNNGLKRDFSRTTPNGNPFIRWPKESEGEVPDTPGNCYRTKLFRKFAEKNLNFEASATSPICRTCKLNFNCHEGTGQQYHASFRSDRRDALKANRIRAHADSMPSPSSDGDDDNTMKDPDSFVHEEAGLFWDEVSTQFKSTKQVEVGIEDFEQVWGELEQKLPLLHEKLKPVRLVLRLLLTGEIKPTSQKDRHGFDDALIKEMLPAPPEDLGEIIWQLREIRKPDLSFLSKQPEFLGYNEGKALGISNAIRKTANEHFKRQANQEFFSNFDRIALNWLIPFLEVWGGSRGALRCAWQKLIITIEDNRHLELARSVAFNIFLDATMSREELAMLLKVDPEEIYVIEQDLPKQDNLRIIQITGLGNLGKERSFSMQQRVAAIKAQLKKQDKDAVIGEWKKYASDGDGQWFKNLRGSNEFQDASTLAVFGVPHPNVGHLQALYQTLTGEYAPLDKSHEGLQNFIEGKIQAEIEQAMGRLRAHNRQREQLTFVFVGDYDLSFLGLPVEQIDAFEFCPEAGTAAQQTRYHVLQAFKQLTEDGAKITQSSLAGAIGKSQALIAKLAREMGGWRRLKKILLVLYNSLYRESNNFAEGLVGLTEDEQFLVREYLPCLTYSQSPDETVGELLSLLKGMGAASMTRILTSASPECKAHILAAVALVMNPNDEFVLRLSG